MSRADQNSMNFWNRYRVYLRILSAMGLFVNWETSWQWCHSKLYPLLERGICAGIKKLAWLLGQCFCEWKASEQKYLGEYAKGKIYQLWKRVFGIVSSDWLVWNDSAWQVYHAGPLPFNWPILPLLVVLFDRLQINHTTLGCCLKTKIIEHTPCDFPSENELHWPVWRIH